MKSLTSFSRKVSLALLSVGTLSFGLLPAHAQVNTSPPQPIVRSAVATPLVADIGVARVITVTGTWPNGCVPQSARVEAQYVEFTRTIVVRLIGASAGAACTQALKDYTVEIPYTPTVAGASTVLVYSAEVSGGDPVVYRAEGRLVVAPAKTVWAADDISGLWYDPKTSGSGLTFVHNYQQTNNVFGTWYVYDQQGLPYWYTLQAPVWKVNGTVLEGKLYQSRGTPCVSAVLACPSVAIPPPVEIGTFRIEFTGLGPPQIGAGPTARIDAIAPNGVLLFSSTIQRLTL
jgi:hypothetical protein